ncbi:MAG: GIY-YIG nuclease family protein [Chloroflexota bacterium]
MFYTYILRSEQLQRYYVGSTQDVENRLNEHNAGKSKSTRAGIPWRLIHVEEFPTRSEAMLRERKIKARGVERYLADIGKITRWLARGAGAPRSRVRIPAPRPTTNRRDTENTQCFLCLCCLMLKFARRPIWHRSLMESLKPSISRMDKLPWCAPMNAGGRRFRIVF